MTFQDLKMHQSTIFRLLTLTLQIIEIVYFWCKFVFSFLGQLLPPWSKLRTGKICTNFQSYLRKPCSAGISPPFHFFFRGSIPLDPPSKAVLVCPPPLAPSALDLPLCIYGTYMFTLHICLYMHGQ